MNSNRTWVSTKVAGIFSLVLVLTGINGVRAGELPLRQYGLDAGLVQLQINVITQDSRGFIWTGTMGGINLFTGAEVYSFTHKNGLKNEQVHYLGEITPDTMWIGTKGGLGYLPLISTDSIFWIENSSAYEIRALVRFHDQIYVSTFYNGVKRLHGNRLESVARSGLPDNTTILDIAEWRDSLWVATDQGLYKWHNDYFEPTPVHSYVTRLKSSPEGLWYGSANGLGVYQEGRYRTILTNKIITDIYVRDGEVIASLYYTGFARYRLQGDQAPLVFSRSQGLPDTYFRSIFTDRQGSIWLGTDGVGLVQVLPYHFEGFTKKSGLNNTKINSITRWGRNLLVATEGGVYVSTDHKTFSPIEGVGLKPVLFVHPWPDNRLLVAVEGQTLLYQRDGNGHYRESERLLNSTTLDMETFRDTIWLATSSGLWRLYHGKWRAYPVESGFSSNECHALAILKDGILVATDRGANFVHHNQLQVWQPGQMIWDVAVDSRDRAYLATDKGLLVVDSTGRRIGYYGLEEGLPGDAIHSVTVLADSNVWMGTNQGVVNFTGTEFHLFDHADGLPCDEMNNHAIYADTDGIWIGGINGLTHFPQTIQSRDHSLQIEPYQFLENDRLVSAWRSSYPHNPPTLTVKLGAPDFLIDQIEFRYKYLNRPGDWVNLGANPDLKVGTLFPGDYQIAVQARKLDTPPWGKTFHLPSLTIRLPVYLRWDFLAGVLILSVLLFSGLTYAGVRYKHERETMKRQKDEIALAREFNSQISEIALARTAKKFKLSLDSYALKEFSGDFYYTFRSVGNRFCVILGDVSGSGLETSYMNGFLKMSLSSQDWQNMTLTKWLREINRALHRLPKTGLNVALSTYVVQEELDEVYCMTAGNPQPFLIKANHVPRLLPVKLSPPLGVFPDCEPHWYTHHIKPGEILGLHSDGLRFNYSKLARGNSVTLDADTALSAPAIVHTLKQNKWLLRNMDDWTILTLYYLPRKRKR